jgi:glyoxylase-like metal-dependent hydrolase (beta-lactamase superfamily II)
VEQHLLPLKDKFTLIDMDTTIVAGVRTVSAPGHTPGHIGIMIESEGEKCLHMVDAMHHPIQMLNPNWSPNFDKDPVLSTQTRRNLAQDAADGNYLVMAYHFAFPGLGSVQAEGNAFRFSPLTL